MIQYIILAVVGVIALAAGIVLIVLKKKVAGIVLTVCGALAAVAGVVLSLCALILVDYIHNKPAADVTIEQETVPVLVTEDDPEEEPDVDGVIGDEVGDDWRTWRSYSEDYMINDGLTVCVSLLDDLKGYAVYNSSNGDRIGTIINTSDSDLESWEVKAEDTDGDGTNELGMVLADGERLWFRYTGEEWSEDNTAGCFEPVTAE